MSPPGIKPATPRFQRDTSNHSAKLTVNDMLLKLLHYFEIPINTRGINCDIVFMKSSKYNYN